MLAVIAEIYLSFTFYNHWPLTVTYCKLTGAQTSHGKSARPDNVDPSFNLPANFTYKKVST